MAREKGDGETEKVFCGNTKVFSPFSLLLSPSLSLSLLFPYGIRHKTILQDA